MTQFQYTIPQKFLDINKKFWPVIPFSSEYFIVDLLTADHEYYNVHLITARALANILKAQPVALLPSCKDQELIKLVNSYGINNIIFLADIKISKKLQIWLVSYATFLWFKTRTKEQRLKIEYKNSLIGHYIYDTYLNSTGLGTVKLYDFRYAKLIYQALELYNQFTQIFNSKKIILYFGSEQAYIGGGIPSTVAISKNIKVFYRKFGPNRVVYKAYTKEEDLCIYPGHPNLSDFESELKSNKEEVLKWADKYLNNLFHGEVEVSDWNAQNAYKKSRLLTEAEIKNLFGHKYNYRVFILSHIFVDAAHGYKESIFPDYEIWLKETLRIAKDRSDTLWIVKPHPCEKDYFLKTRAVDVCKKFLCYENIKIFPEKVSAANLLDYIDAMITVRGTAAIEYSAAKGIPVITAGRNMFDEGNFCIRPKDKKEYRDILMNMEFSRLSDEKIKRAKVYLYVYNYLNRIEMPLLSNINFDTMNVTPDEIYNYLAKILEIIDYNNLFSNSFINYLNKKLLC